MYTMTVLSFFVGACIGCVSVYTYGAYGAFIGFVPLIVARLFMYIGKIPVENGTPEETEEEAKKKHSKRQICWRTIRNCDRSPQNLCGASFLLQNTLNMQIKTCRDQYRSCRLTVRSVLRDAAGLTSQYWHSVRCLKEHGCSDKWMRYAAKR